MNDQGLLRTETALLVPGDRYDAPVPAKARAADVFVAILRRDLAVAVGELPSTIAQMVLQPVFLLFVFGKVLTGLGFARPGYLEVLYPGIVALTVVLTGMQYTALPLVLEFSYTMEIEDRLLAPVSTGLVAVEKIIFAALRSLVAAAVMFPVGLLMLGTIPWQASSAPTVLLVLVLGAFIGAAAGLLLGTIVPPNKIRMMMTLILTPLMFTGSVQYPWSALTELRWFQVVSALNPLTYISEGLRGSMAPSVPHLDTSVCIGVSLVFLVVLATLGTSHFRRRAVT